MTKSPFFLDNRTQVFSGSPGLQGRLAAFPFTEGAFLFRLSQSRYDFISLFSDWLSKEQVN